MANNPTTGMSLDRGPAAWRRQIHAGYVDAQNGRPWSADYGRMSRSEQLAYETGRLLTREALAEGFAFPIWRGDKAGCRPVTDLWNAVHRKLGRAIVPPDWVEPPPVEAVAA